MKEQRMKQEPRRLEQETGEGKMRSKEQEPAEYDEGTGTYEGRGAEGNIRGRRKRTGRNRNGERR
jgi:hypothetical protein